MSYGVLLLLGGAVLLDARANSRKCITLSRMIHLGAECLYLCLYLFSIQEYYCFYLSALWMFVMDLWFDTIKYIDM